MRQARIDRGEREGLTTGDRTELAQLRRENARLRMGVIFSNERRPPG